MSDQPAISQLPGGTPVPTAAAAATPPPSKPIPKLPIGAILSAAPSNLDAFLAHLHRCMQTPSGIDTVLLLICYSSRLAANLLESASQSALQRSARKLVALAFSLPQNTTILLSGQPASPAAAIAIQLATRLRALSALLTDGRTFMRLWGLLGMYFWARRLALGALNAKSDEKKAGSSASGEIFDKTVAWTQLVSTVIFQALENGAYLASKGVLGWSPKTQGKAILWSTRFWALYVGTELGRLIVEQLRKQQGGDVSSAEHVKWMEEWRSKFVRNAAWAPLTLHWSGGAFLSDGAVSALATVPGVIQMRQLWRDTAKA